MVHQSKGHLNGSFSESSPKAELRVLFFFRWKRGGFWGRVTVITYHRHHHHRHHHHHHHHLVSLSLLSLTYLVFFLNFGDECCYCQMKKKPFGTFHSYFVGGFDSCSSRNFNILHLYDKFYRVLRRFPGVEELL